MNMKTFRIAILGCFALCAIFLPSAYGHHRSGSFALPELVVAGDFDRDGNLDLAVNLTGFDNVAIFIGDGQGSFSLKGHIGTDTLNKGIATADMDGDGNLDLVVSNDWGYTLQTFLGDGVGGFSFNNELKGDGEPTRLRLKDFNNDGRLDIAVNAPSEERILLFLGDGKGNFANPPEEFEDLPHDLGLAAGDFNRDGNLDIAAATSTIKGADPGSHLNILLGDGAGGFTMSAVFPIERDPESLQAGDLDGDGILDLVVAGALAKNSTGNFVSTFLGDGTGNFALKQTTELGPGILEGEIALADLNEDGKLDVAFPEESQGAAHGTTIPLFFGDGIGGLAAGPVLTVGQEPHTVIAADVNKDGHIDLINSNRTDGTISVLLGDGTGNFSSPAFFSVICDTCLE